LKTDRDSTVADENSAGGSEFQTDGVESRKARLEKYVQVNGWTSSGIDRWFICMAANGWIVTQTIIQSQKNTSLKSK